jgi:hypothetical protein
MEHDRLNGTCLLYNILLFPTPFARDVSPSNIVLSDGRGILLDFHAARSLARSSSPILDKTGKRAYMALRLHCEMPQHSATTDMESLFYSLMDVASGGEALPWRTMLDDEVAVSSSKYSTVRWAHQWQKALSHCEEQLRPLLERVRDVVRQDDPTFEAYLTAFGVEDG